MESPDNFTKKSKPPSIASFIPLVIIIVGIFLIIGQFFSNASAYLQSLFWQVNHPTVYNFSKFDYLLHDYVQNGLVDYRSLKNSTELTYVLNELSHTEPDKLEPNNQLAFWINTYNLLVIKSVVDHYPLSSITSIEESISLHKFVVGGKTYSLEDIEAFEIKPRLASSVEPLFLVCGGSVGFPALLNHAINSDTLASDARVSTIKFLVNPNNVYYNSKLNVLLLSPFFKWHQTLFGITNKVPVPFINNYLSPDNRIPVDNRRLKIEYKSTFNWLLNDTNLLKRYGSNSD